MNEIISAGVPRGIGFSHVISAGNEAGVTSAELIDYFVADPATDVILCVLETARDPGLFMEAASRAFEARKPIVVLKMGRSPKGKRSAFTHTRADAGNDAVYSALFRQNGIVRVNDLDELVDMGALLSHAIAVVRVRRTERAAIIEISGGGKELVCDTAATAGVPLPDLTPETEAAVAKANPEDIYPTNPIDTGGSWVQADKAEVYPATMEAFANQPDFDVIVSRYTIPRMGSLGVLKNRIAEMEAARAAHPDRLFVVLSRTSDQYSPEWEQVVREKRIPFLQGYGRGLRALGRLAEYSLAVHRPRSDAAPPPNAAEDVPAARPLPDADAKQILAAAGLTVAAANPGLGLEVRLGAHRDLQFGPVVTFGLGGLLAEVSDDVAVRVAPVSADDAAAMLDEIRGHRVLEAGPGRPATDRIAIRDALCRLSGLMQQRPDIASIEVAAFAQEKGLVATQASIAVGGG
jgi:acyl-CoA synthetase (NDP forming)